MQTLVESFGDNFIGSVKFWQWPRFFPPKHCWIVAVMLGLCLALAPRLSGNRKAWFIGLTEASQTKNFPFLWVAKVLVGRLLPLYGSNYQLPQIWQFTRDVEFHNETRQGRNLQASPQHEAAKDSNQWTWGRILAVFLCWTCHSSICLHRVLSESVTCNGLLRTMCLPRRLWQRISCNMEEAW